MAKDRYRKVRRALREHKQGKFFERVEQLIRTKHERKIGKVDIPVGRRARQLFRNALLEAKAEAANAR